MGQTESSGAGESDERNPWGPTYTDEKDGATKKRVVLITGGNSGLGFESARSLLVTGFRVIIACRSKEKAEAACAALREKTGATDDDISYSLLDVSSLSSVSTFAEEFLADPSNLVHVLMCNAGIMMGPKRVTPEGYDLQLATNYLGHFLLVEKLRERLIASKPARVIFVSSIAARFGHVHWGNINFSTPKDEDYSSLGAYQQSKLLQVIHSRELANRLKGTGVTSNSCEPGVVKTNLSKGITNSPAMRRRLENGISVEEGALTQIKLAADASCSGISGQHWEKCSIISQGFSKFKFLIAAHDLRASVGPRLFDFTEKLLKDPTYSE
eukprot:g2158.t1